MVVLDTNILIDHLRRPTGASVLSQFVRKHPNEELAISVITIQELYEGKSTAVEKRERDMLVSLAPLKILGYSREIAETAGKICRDTTKKYDFPDAAIAAGCLVNHCSLATLNKKDFTGINGLEMVEINPR